MKNIEVTDELYEALSELSDEYFNQDSRATAKPYLFQIQEEVEVAAYDGQGEEMWANSDGDEIRNEQEMREYIADYMYDADTSLHNLPDNEAKSIIEERLEEMDSWDLKYFLEDECHHDWRRHSVTTAYRYHNTFLTAKACQEHIDSNSYHYNKPVCYLNHAWRNPELNLLVELLKTVKNA